MTNLERLLDLVSRAVTEKPGSKVHVEMTRLADGNFTFDDANDRYVVGRNITIVIKIEQPK